MRRRTPLTTQQHGEVGRALFDARRQLGELTSGTLRRGVPAAVLDAALNVDRRLFALSLRLCDSLGEAGHTLYPLDVPPAEGGVPRGSPGQLSPDEHRAVGAELYRLRGRLMDLGVLLADAHPKASGLGRAARGPQRALDRLRHVLDELFYRQHPGAFDTRAYYPGTTGGRGATHVGPRAVRRPDADRLAIAPDHAACGRRTPRRTAPPSQPGATHMKIDMRPIDDVKPYSRNPRVNDAAVDAVAASLKEFGFRQPVVVDEDFVIVVGHTRWKAAKKLGMTHVPVHVALDLTPAQAKAYRIADNQTASIAEWDKALLPLELAGLGEMNFDLGLLGFDPDELARWLNGSGSAGLTDPDEVPPLPAEPVTKPGDLLLLGDHRLLCGDSTKAEDVQRLLDGAVPFLMVTDPPYGVEYDYDPEWRHRSGLNNSKRTGKVQNDDRCDWTDTYKLFPGTVAYVWHGGIHAGEVAAHLEEAGFQIRTQIIWSKSRFAISRGAYHWQHEPAWYAVREGAMGGAKWCGDRSQSTVWDVPQQDDGTGETVHGTQKPVECMARPIRHHGGKGDDVYDPFLGSGTTLIGAEQLGRRCLAIEVDPRYIDVAVERWEKFTGKKSERVTENTPAVAEVSSGGRPK